LLNVLLQIANKLGLLKKKGFNSIKMSVLSFIGFGCFVSCLWLESFYVSISNGPAIIGDLCFFAGISKWGPFCSCFSNMFFSMRFALCLRLCLCKCCYKILSLCVVVRGFYLCL
jgi:hypothetical protein